MVRLQETANNPGLNTLRDFVNQMLAQLTAVFALIKYKLEQLDKGNFSNQLDADFIKKHGEIYQRLSGDFEEINRSLQNTALRLAETTEKNHTQNWIKTGQAQLNEVLSGDQSLKKLAEKAINFLTPYLNAQVGAFYLMELTIDKVPQLRLVATHAYTWRKSASTTYKIGEGIVGQAAYEGKPFVIGNAPEGHMLIDSGLGESAPRAILVMPFMYEGEIKGVMELATLESFTQSQLDFLSQAMQILAVAIHTAQSHDRVQELLEQAQAQSAVLQQQTQELEQQQSALQQSNEQLQSQSEELQAQTEELQSQTEELQSQQEELRQTNEALEMRGKELERQREAVRQQNHELEKAQAIVEAKAEELALASKYKSEFLANMSHELRTPLNSLLILAQMLMENKEGRLSEKQVEYARTIHVSGKDLLSLINEILDLSKVEAGKIDLHPETCNLKHLIAGLEQKFRHMADGKKLSFKIQTVPQLPETLHVDTQRLKQIINNLLSNAFKFTHDGGVTLEIRRPLATEDLSRSGLEAARGIAICVSDTGIGIPKDKQKTVFEAFQQADGSTSRKYGGTGLGLSISRQLAQVMGGEIHLDSEPGHGSRFCVFLPERFIPNAVPEEREAEVVTPPRRQPESKPAAATTPEVSPASAPVAIQDDREKLKTDSKSLLVIEDDPTFAKLLMQLAREKGFLCLYAADGQAGLRLVETYKPGAIILDVGLPQVDGWTVMERLKDSADTRHIPVHFVSGADYHQEARRMGAVGYSLKPVSMMELSDAFHKIERIISKSVKSLLLVSDSEKHHQAILDILDNDALDIQVRATQAEALQELQRRLPDCLILDAGVENSSGIRLESAEEEVLKQVADLLTVKSIHSPERLLDEATLFLHQVEAKLPQAQQQTLRMMHDKETILKGKKVMIVDDDMRNTFALSATLEEKAVEVLIAANGLESLAMLAENPDTALVLMDIMMPEMDGYEAMRKIREQPALRKLPIIALTAKAMKGDRAKCIEAGASDYLAKPVDTNKLLSLLRVWLYQ
jgi:signal transduction histidine kinase/CheY-like chemotaxis protein